MNTILQEVGTFMKLTKQSYCRICYRDYEGVEVVYYVVADITHNSLLAHCLQ